MIAELFYFVELFELKVGVKAENKKRITINK